MLLNICKYILFYAQKLACFNIFHYLCIRNYELKTIVIMPVIIGFWIGRMIGSMVVAIMRAVFRLLYWTAVLVVRLVKYAYVAAEYLIGRIWEGGKYAVDHYKLNLRKG